MDVLQAFDQWALARGMRGRDIYDTIAKVMRYWVSFAMAKVPLGDPARVRAGLMRQIRSYSALGRIVHSGGRNAGTRRADALRGTVASAIVAILNYKGARDLAKARSPQFYARVNEYIRKRAYSVNHHRGGFIPAISVLGRGKGSDPAASGGVRMPKYRHPAGSMAHSFTDELAHILVENFASQSGEHPFRTRPVGITGLAGRAFEEALGEVGVMIGEFLRRDMENAASVAGLSVKGAAPGVVVPMPSFAAAA